MFSVKTQSEVEAQENLHRHLLNRLTAILGFIDANGFNRDQKLDHIRAIAQSSVNQLKKVLK